MIYEKFASYFDLKIKILPNRPSPDHFIWNGKNNIIYITKNMLGMAILHEIGHYQIAHQARRNMPEYGLGTGPEIWCKEIKSSVPSNEAETEETYASILTICYSRMLGGIDYKNTKDFKHSLDLLPGFSVENWDSRRNDKEFRWLENSGFILPSGYSTLKLRTNEELSTKVKR